MRAIVLILSQNWYKNVGFKRCGDLTYEDLERLNKADTHARELSTTDIASCPKKYQSGMQGPLNNAPEGPKSFRRRKNKGS